MQFKKLLKNIKTSEIFGDTNVSVTGITDDSRKAKTGSLFVAIKGITHDAHDYIPEVIQKGARVIVGERTPKIEWLQKVTYIQVANSRKALSFLAAAWYGHPARKLKIIGITGTKGKTTAAYSLYQLLKAGKKQVGLISTIGAKVGKKTYDTGLHVSNPEPLELHKLLAEMVTDGATHAVIEVTSHGLDQERVAGIDFDIAVLTNIAPEHLDYHRTFDNYRNAKAKLFTKSLHWFLNKDDESYNFLQKQKNGSQFVTTYGINNSADFQAVNIGIDSKSKFIIKTAEERIDLQTPLLGEYNIANILAAVAVSRFLAVPWEIIKNSLAKLEAPTGRLEKIPNSLGIELFIDFAHTPDSLENVLTLLQKRKKGRLISVFGCAGERDTKKRSKMGKIAANLCDISIFTAEDPRGESIHAILEEMVKGAKLTEAVEVDPTVFQELIDGHVYMRIPLRQEAIIAAVRHFAQKGDIVVVLGKGHEQSMAYKGVEHSWSDNVAIKTALALDLKKVAILLAAGKGTRMKSPFPKVINEIAGRPILSYSIENVRNAGFGTVIIVVGYKKELVKKEVAGAVIFADQPEALGTGHAAHQGLKKVDEAATKDALVMNGDDSAFYYPSTINAIYEGHKNKGAAVSFVSLINEQPTGLGRIVRDKKGKLVGIVEDKDATEEQKKITEVNDGMYIFDVAWAKKHFAKIKKSASGEYYIVDLVKIALEEGKPVYTYILKKSEEWVGVNTQEELAKADEKKRQS